MSAGPRPAVLLPKSAAGVLAGVLLPSRRAHGLRALAVHAGSRTRHAIPRPERRTLLDRIATPALPHRLSSQRPHACRRVSRAGRDRRTGLTTSSSGFVVAMTEEARS